MDDCARRASEAGTAPTTGGAGWSLASGFAGVTLGWLGATFGRASGAVTETTGMRSGFAMLSARLRELDLVETPDEEVAGASCDSTDAFLACLVMLAAGSPVLGDQFVALSREQGYDTGKCGFLKKNLIKTFRRGRAELGYSDFSDTMQ